MIFQPVSVISFRTDDGGTDLSLLEGLAGIRGVGGFSSFDYAVICTDGIDNFKKRPDMTVLDFPCYVALSQGGVHGTDSALLQGIARLSGGACMPLDKSEQLVGIASGEKSEAIVSCLRLVGLEEDALFDESHAYFGDFSERALEQSAYLIDRLVERG